MGGAGGPPACPGCLSAQSVPRLCPPPPPSPHVVEVLSQRIDSRCFHHSPQSRSKTNSHQPRECPSCDTGRRRRGACPGAVRAA